jgi:hypothetical protein
MPSSKKPISRMPQDERRREIADIYAAANKRTKHFINKEGSPVTSIPLESEDIRRLARLERSVKIHKGRRKRANQIFAELSMPQLEDARALCPEVAVLQVSPAEVAVSGAGAGLSQDREPDLVSTGRY